MQVRIKVKRHASLGTEITQLLCFAETVQKGFHDIRLPVRAQQLNLCLKTQCDIRVHLHGRAVSEIRFELQGVDVFPGSIGQDKIARYDSTDFTDVAASVELY